MGLKTFHRCGMALLLWAVSGLCSFAGDFVAPSDTPSRFRRDQLPLDVEMLASLAQNLVTAARALDVKTPVNRRGAAQLLALAAALDPGNTKARELMSDFRKNRHVAEAGNRAMAKNIDEIQRIRDGLNFPEAGEQGHALVDYLTDLLHLLDPPQAAATTAEVGNWAGWVPALSFYEPKSLVEPEQEKPEPINGEPSFLLTKAEVTTLIWKKTGNEQPATWVLSPEKLQMRTEPKNDGQNNHAPFSIIIHAPTESAEAPPISSIITQLLKKQHGSLPNYGKILIGSDLLEESLVSKNRIYISAAAAVLASAAITGVEPDATIIGSVDATGAFILPPKFWEQLRALGPGKGGRLVLPMDAATSALPAILAMENPKFFFDYEVVLASNFQELLDLSAKEPAEPIAKASELFQQVREKLGTQPIGQYVANTFIRRRLSDIFQQAPNHASAKMLGIQGAGNRPIQVSRVIFATELRHALEPLEWLLKKTEPRLDASEYPNIMPSYEAFLERFDPLTRYAERSEDDLITKTKDLISQIRTLERATRSRGDYYEAQLALNAAHTALIKTYTAFSELLDTACDDKESHAE